MDTTKAVTHVSLCAGYGGIDLGLKRAIPDLRTIAFSEIEAFACANLVAKMEAGQLDPAPIWTDLKTFPWSSFRGKVGILSGGYPCQPFSAAGKRLGADDPRHLWPFIAAGIVAMRPAVCFFENVEGHISLGLREVIGELEEIGYRATWGVFSAAEVGAPHQRKRVFILAHRLCERGQLPNWWRFAAEQMSVSNGTTGRDELALAVEQGPQGSASEPLHSGGLQSEIGRGCDAAWPSRPGQPQFPWEPPRVVGNQPADLGDTEGERTGGLPIGAGEGQPGFKGASSVGAVVGDARVQESRWLPSGSGRDEVPEAGQSSGAMGDAESQRSTTQRPQHARLGGELCVASASSQSESDRRQTEPALGGDADGSAGGMDYAKLCISGDSRVDELRLLGNGVVPATAERAFNVLASRLFS